MDVTLQELALLEFIRDEGGASYYKISERMNKVLGDPFLVTVLVKKGLIQQQYCITPRGEEILKNNT